MKEFRVLVVCSGNTCRSPMAGGLVREILRENGLGGEVATAGLYPGRTLAEYAVQVMKEIGIDISDDHPKGMSPELMEWANVVIPVTNAIADDLLERYAESVAKIRRLTRDVEDPVCQPILKYREVREDLREELVKVLEGLAGD